MEKYRNKSGSSGVSAFAVGADYIAVRFVDSNRIYKYSYRSAGKSKVEKMKRLAAAGEGLSTFISRHVKELYEPE